MKHIGKILKKYMIYILFIVVLLFIQAQCDLKLPEYTSNIINVGIQSKGIEDAVFDKVSENTLDCIVAISGSYDIYDYYKKNSKDIYELKTNVNREELQELLLKPTVFYFFYSQMEGAVLDPNALVFGMTNETTSEFSFLAYSITFFTFSSFSASDNWFSETFAI